MLSKKKVMLNAGETRCIRISIHSIKDQNFVIEEASFSLLRLKDKVEESNGNCKIYEHEIEAIVSPKKRGTYTLDIKYVILDEVLIEPIELKVV